MKVLIVFLLVSSAMGMAPTTRAPRVLPMMLLCLALTTLLYSYRFV